MGRFFDPEKSGQLRKEWRVPFIVFLAVLVSAWVGYEYYVNTFPRTTVTALVHVALLVLTAPFIVLGLFTLQSGEHFAAPTGPAAVKAERRSNRLGRIGLVLLLVGLGVFWISSTYLSQTFEERAVVLLLGSVFFVPGILLMVYSQNVDHTLGFLPKNLTSEELEARIREKTSLARFARNVLLFIAGIAALTGVIWYFPDFPHFMEANSKPITVVIAAGVVGWIVMQSRRQSRERAALGSPPRQEVPAPKVPLSPIESRIMVAARAQYVVLAIGLVGAFAASDFIPSDAMPPLKYVPQACVATSVAIVIVIRIWIILKTRLLRSE